MPGSYESLFHQQGGNFMVILRDQPAAEELLRGPLLERAIGVIYRPQTERMSHYFEARLPEQFDAVLHFDETRAVEPLERTSLWVPDEAPDTFPSAL
jgi:erythromycin esterase-like protein